MTPAKVRSREDLVLLVKAGTRLPYLFFWGHRPLPNGEIGKPCFSQWWPATFVVSGASYPSAEHFMMAEKARLFGDEDTRAQILDAASPKAAKELGRRVRNFDEAVWSKSRFEFVVAGNLAKFSQNPELKAFLLSTGHQVLVEASPVDRIWGIGLAANDERAMKPEAWRGLNLLGFALMEVRERLATDSNG
jgi:ribA/ribD-fused uncharacterized protein